MKNFCTRWGIGIMSVLLLAAGLGACKLEKVAPMQEQAKDISGDWRIIKATRNGTDLTALVDLSQFRISFKDGKYTLISKVPFLVSQDGIYTLDDPKYPFKISFTAGSNQPVATAFNFPIVNGVRQLSITFSPGCANNSYVYVFEKNK